MLLPNDSVVAVVEMVFIIFSQIYLGVPQGQSMPCLFQPSVISGYSEIPLLFCLFFSF